MPGGIVSADDMHDATSRATGFGLKAQRIGFGLIALFILLAPAAGQVFGLHHLLLREWVMYSDVGVGIPKGEFRIWQGDIPVAQLSPLEALELEAYPPVIHYTFAQRILSDEDFPRFAARLCAARDAYGADRVSFEGMVGTRLGWRAASHDDLCATTTHRISATETSQGSLHVE